MKKNSLWMGISGAMGFCFFLIANFSTILVELNVVAGTIQIAINIFVFLVWQYGFRHSTGFRKFVAFWGVIIPIIMTTVTILRVIIPTFG